MTVAAVMTVCVLLTMSGFQKDCQTIFVRVVSVKISSHDASFPSNHLKFYFLWKTYSLVSDDFCNLSATRVFVRTNGADVKNIKTAKSLIDLFHC